MALKPYKKQAWVDHQVDEATSEIVVLGTPVDKIHLDHLEDGIQTADARAIEALGGVEGLQTTQHSHSNKGVLDGITSALVTAWNSAVTHIADAVKHITAAERTLWNTVSSKADADEVASLMEKKATLATSSISLYVSPTGNDETGNGNAAAPYRTILKAISTVKGLFLDGYNIYIYLSDGVYTESNITIGAIDSITIKGLSNDMTKATVNCVGKFLVALNCQSVSVSDLTVNCTNASDVIHAVNVTNLSVARSRINCTGEGVGDKAAVMLNCSNGYIGGIEFNGCDNCIYAITSSVVTSINGTGTGNDVALTASRSIIMHTGTYPASSTQRRASYAGQIFTQ